VKLDQDYSPITICPDTREQLTHDEIFRSTAVCPRCGHIDTYGICHYEVISVRWNRPSFWERLCGKKTESLRKEDEDAVMNALKGK